jgi:hypothetical protein
VFSAGLDVGSTTVKATVVDAATDKVLWQDYQRHETKQPEKTLEFLRRMGNFQLQCGHDAPIYGVIEGIIEQSGTPYFCFKDLDENKPSGSIRIRVETIDYFLRRYREEVIRKRKAADEIEAQLAALETELRGQAESEPSPAPQFEPEAQGMAAD